MRELKLNHIYHHFKGNNYIVVDVVKSADDPDKKLVIYQALYGDGEKWARELTEFLSEVDHEKYPDVKQKYRFEEITLS